MQQHLLIVDPAFKVTQVEQVLLAGKAILVARFEEGPEQISAWEYVESDGSITECEVHQHAHLQIIYLTIRTSSTSHFVTQITAAITVLRSQDILDKLHSADAFVRRQALALVELAPQDMFIEPVLRLRQDADPQVRYEAQRLTQLLAGSERMTPEKLFNNDVDVNDRRQLLRWVFHSSSTANAEIEKLLRKALVDTDWEVRTTAMIMTVRYGLASLLALVAACNLHTGNGVDQRDQELMQGVRQVALLILSGQTIQLAGNPGIKQQRWQKLYHLLLGIKNPDFDYLAAFVQYFLQPHPGLTQAPPAHPAISVRGQQFFLRDSDVEMLWVPAGMYVLGSDSDETLPLRRESITHGFFISQYHFSEQVTDIFVLPASAINAWLQQLSRRYNTAVTLPTRHQWEMAMRGMDGRKYPWGWGKQLDSFLRQSPWGLAQCCSDTGEWCVQDEDFYIVGEKNFPASHAKKYHGDDAEKALPLRVIITPSIPT